MADVTEQLERAIELAWLDHVNRLDFGIEVVRIAYRDLSVDVDYPAVIVEAGSATPEHGLNGPLYAVGVALTALTYIDDDADQAQMLAIQTQLERLARNIALDALTSVGAGVIFDGNELAGTPEDSEGTIQSKAVEMICHVQADLAAPSTTTTTTTTT